MSDTELSQLRRRVEDAEQHIIQTERDQPDQVMVAVVQMLVNPDPKTVQAVPYIYTPVRLQGPEVIGTSLVPVLLSGSLFIQGTPPVYNPTKTILAPIVNIDGVFWFM